MNKALAFAFLAFISLNLTSQEKKSGPVITDFGKVWSVENPSYQVQTEKEFKVVFDITNSPDGHDQINRSIETAARFLNMHAQSGVSTKNMKVALVVHSKASKDILASEGYKSRFGVDNPNEEMIKQLMDADVEFILCGQSSNSRNLPIEEAIPGVQLSLSAMTALIQLQNDGYRLIKF